jgi:hypothetical protein
MVHRMYHDVYWTKLPIVKASSNLALVLCFVLCSRHVLVWVLGSIAARMRFPTKCLKADCEVRHEQVGDWVPLPHGLANASSKMNRVLSAKAKSRWYSKDSTDKDRKKWVTPQVGGEPKISNLKP